MNAKTELEKELSESKSKIKCAHINNDSYGKFPEKHYYLKVGYSGEELREFLEKLNFNYDGFGGQEVYGLVWLEDGSWIERGEYEGSEWWIRKVYPDIPPVLLQ